jgi:hypothetical protein
MDAAELHAFVCRAAIAAGGVACEELLPPENGVRLADVAFLQEQTIVEVKAIATDRNELLEVRRKAGAIYKRWADRGLVPPRTGTTDVRMIDLPLQLATEINAVAGARVIREMAHANRQIRETAERLGFGDPRGLVIFVVPGHFAANGCMVTNSAIKGLVSQSFRSLNGGIVFEAWTIDDRPSRLLEVTPFSSPGRELPDLRLVERICRCWFEQWSIEKKQNVVVIPLDARGQHLEG